jgi:ATP-dependent exoDNAse (exonuclease V) beta subunit
MTMHKSKGLEFHSVIIPSCSWPIKPKDKEVMWCVPQEDLYNQIPLLPISVNKAKDDSIFAADRRTEELRTLVDNINVLYVAFTRAKHNLVILTGNKVDVKMEDLGNEAHTINNAQSFLVNAMPPQMEQYDVEGVITQYQYGNIVPSTKKKEKDVDNPMEGNYTPLVINYTSCPSVAQFRQSYESDLFMTEDNPSMQQHAQRIRLISLGNLYHSIFEHIHTAADIQHAIQLLESKGCFTTLLDATEAEATVTKLIEDISIEHPEWFSSDWQVLNERAILFIEHQAPAVRRPDRVVVKGQQAIIIDYKTAHGAVRQAADGTYLPPTKNQQQIEEYKQLLTQIGYTDIKAYLWYILDEIVVEVTSESDTK